MADDLAGQGGRERSLRVRLLDKEYPLRVAPGAEEATFRIAKEVDDRMRQIRRAIPYQPELTVAVMTALAMAEEVATKQAEIDRLRQAIASEAEVLERKLKGAVGG
jgi:cell division protein ZapA